MTWQEMTVDGLVGWARGDGPLAAVVLHGGPGIEDYMRPPAEEVLAAGDGRLRVAHYQQRGQVPSTLEGPLNLEQFVADVASVVEHLSGDRSVLVGHSWGAHLAMHVAVRRPELVAGMLFLDPLGGVDDGGAGAMGDVLATRIGPRGREALAEVDRDESMSVDEREAARLRVLWPGYFADPAGAPPAPELAVSSEVMAALLGDALPALEDGYLASRLPDVDVPTVYQYGASSPIDPDVNARTAALMSGAMVDLVDCGHFSWIEQPGSVERAMRRLLDTASEPR